MKKLVGVALAFVAIGLALDLFGVKGNIPRALFLAVMISSMGYVASRQYGLRRDLTK